MTTAFHVQFPNCPDCGAGFKHIESVTNYSPYFGMTIRLECDRMATCHQIKPDEAARGTAYAARPTRCLQRELDQLKAGAHSHQHIHTGEEAE